MFIKALKINFVFIYFINQTKHMFDLKATGLNIKAAPAKKWHGRRYRYNISVSSTYLKKKLDIPTRYSAFIKWQNIVVVIWYKPRRCVVIAVINMNKRHHNWNVNHSNCKKHENRRWNPKCHCVTLLFSFVVTIEMTITLGWSFNVKSNEIWNKFLMFRYIWVVSFFTLFYNLIQRIV